ncbi:MAG: SCO family protein, partial [Wenzhouxiangellaceae bacterium]
MSNLATSFRFILAVFVLSAAMDALANGKQPAKYRLSDQIHHVPEILLLDQTGAAESFDELVKRKPRTIISFIFTSCPGICPMITANMVRSVPKLESFGEEFQILLVSVDPEHDTPERLAAYAKRFQAGPEITFLTGTNDTIFQVLRSLDAVYEGSNRMNHQPITLIATEQPNKWRRIDGLVGSDVLIEQYGMLVQNIA